MSKNSFSKQNKIQITNRVKFSIAEISKNQTHLLTRHSKTIKAALSALDHPILPHYMLIMALTLFKKEFANTMIRKWPLRKQFSFFAFKFFGFRFFFFKKLFDTATATFIFQLKPRSLKISNVHF